MRDHLAAHAHGTATAADFAAALSRAAGADVAGVMASFIDNPGVPLVTGRVECAGDTATLHVAQRRLAPGTPAERWRIPICVRHGTAAGAARRECFVLDGERGEHAIDRCPSWVAWNAGGIGYYIVATDGESLARLVASRARFDDDELLAAVNDADNLVKDGVLPVGDALRATTPLLARATPAMREALIYLEWRAIGFVDDADRAALYARVRKRFGAAARAQPLVGPPGESAEARDARTMLITMVSDAGDPFHAREAQRLTRAWIADRDQLAFGDRGTVLRVAARHGGPELFADLEAAARVAGRADQRWMLSTLVLFTDPALVERAVRLALTDAVNPRNVSALFRARSELRDIPVRVVTENLDALLERLPAELDVLPVYLGMVLRTPEQRGRYVAAFEPRVASIKNGAGAYREALASVDRWMEVAAIQRPSLRAWLTSGKPRQPAPRR